MAVGPGSFGYRVYFDAFRLRGGSGQGDLSKKAPPSLGAIADVDGSDDTKKEGKKLQTGAEQTPAQSPAGGQPSSRSKTVAASRNFTATAEGGLPSSGW